MEITGVHLEDAAVCIAEVETGDMVFLEPLVANDTMLTCSLLSEDAREAADASGRPRKISSEKLAINTGILESASCIIII